MRGNFSEIITASWEWTKTILFRPFNLKKWLVLGLIALLAGQLTYGFNFKGSFNQPEVKKSQETAVIESDPGINGQPSYPSGSSFFKRLFLVVKEKQKIFFILTLLIIFVFFISAWLYSHFSFVFIEAVVKNDAAVKKPFRNNKASGQSYFLWNILVSLAGLTFIILMTVFTFIFLSGREKMAFNLFFLVMTLIISGIIFSLLSFIVRNFILPVMYKDKTGVLKAWPKVFNIILANKGDVWLYLLIKVGLILAASFLAMGVVMLISFSLIVPLGITTGILFLGYRIMPDFLRFVYTGASLGVGRSVLLFIIFCINCFFLPVPVFLQTFNLKFLARIDEKYDVFKITSKEVSR